MSRNRIEGFTDGVIAVVITVMVLSLRPPAGATWTILGLYYQSWRSTCSASCS